jgi:hypothetical protein
MKLHNAVENRAHVTAHPALARRNPGVSLISLHLVLAIWIRLQRAPSSSLAEMRFVACASPKRSYTCEMNDVAQGLIRSFPLRFLP